MICLVFISFYSKRVILLRVPGGDSLVTSSDAMHVTCAYCNEMFFVSIPLVLVSHICELVSCSVVSNVLCLPHSKFCSLLYRNCFDLCIFSNYLQWCIHFVLYLWHFCAHQFIKWCLHGNSTIQLNNMTLHIMSFCLIISKTVLTCHCAFLCHAVVVLCVCSVKLDSVNNLYHYHYICYVWSQCNDDGWLL